jgi:hypothetical protein
MLMCKFLHQKLALGAGAMPFPAMSGVAEWSEYFFQQGTASKALALAFPPNTAIGRWCHPSTHPQLLWDSPSFAK